MTENDEGIADLTLYGKEVGNTSENPWVYEYHVLERSGFPYRGGGAKSFIIILLITRTILR